MSLTLPLERRIRSRQRVTLDNGIGRAFFSNVARCCDGDLLGDGNGLIVQVRAAAEPVSEVRCDDPPQLARACYHPGNRHVALQIEAGVFAINTTMCSTTCCVASACQPTFAQVPFRARKPGPTAALPTLTHIITPMTTTSRTGTKMSPAESSTGALGRLRLMQLVSPALPIGAFTYSQGTGMGGRCRLGERQRDTVRLARGPAGRWPDSSGSAGVVPSLRFAKTPTRMPSLTGAECCTRAASPRTACRGRQRACADHLLGDLGIGHATVWRDALSHCQAAPFALAAVHWAIGVEDCALGYAWGWLENQVAAAIKLVPLSQTDGQRVQLALAERLPLAVGRALAIDDEDIGAGAPALAIASARHETQYTRLFRS